MKEVSAQGFRHESDFTVFSDEDENDVFSVGNAYLLTVDGTL